MFALIHMAHETECYDTSVAFYWDGTADEIMAHDWQRHVDAHMTGKWDVIHVTVVECVALNGYTVTI